MGEGLNVHFARHVLSNGKGQGGEKYNWTATITFVPFKSRSQRAEAYRTWVRLFLRTRDREIDSLKGTVRLKREDGV